MYQQTIVCLANSRKPPSGRCIAGKAWVAGVVGPWLRPVSTRPSHEVSEDERRYSNGHLAKLLDIVNIPLLNPSPMQFQHENHVLDAHHYWQKVGVASWAQVGTCLDAHDPQFWSPCQSTHFGVQDKILEATVVTFTSSLKLIHVPRLDVTVHLEGGYQGAPQKRKARGRFTYHGQQYFLSISDAELEDDYLRRGDGQYTIGEAILCISLVEVFYGFSYRVIASVITPERCGTANA
jgi:hypothetical protein